MNDRFKFRYVYENKVYDAAKLDLLWEEVQVDKYDHVDTYSLALAPGSLLQCTGLKDKNGTLIYEGDIVNFGEEIYKVVYRTEWACFVIQAPTSSTNTQTINTVETQTCHMEVIGNIYENPELFEGEKDE